MLNFLIANWDSVIFVVIVLVGIVVFAKIGYTQQIKDMLLYLVVQAEEKYKDGTGLVKYSAVATWLYEKLPSLAKLIFTSKQIEILIEEAVKRMKEYLQENPKAIENILGGE